MVIDTVIAQKEEWKRAGIPVKIALNISAKDLNNKSVMNYLIEIIENRDIDLSILEVELTERGILENQEMVMPFFNDLKRRGVEIALDDFGTGYNSLINLFKFPMDYIKIDKTFIDCITDDTYKIIIESIIRVAHNMG